MWFRCYASDLEQGDCRAQLVQRIDSVGVFIEASGDAEGGVDIKAEEGGVQGGEVRMVAAFV